jgi:hypothetical protein
LTQKAIFKDLTPLLLFLKVSNIEYICLKNHTK